MNTNQRIPDQTLQWIRTCVPIPGLIAGTQLKPSGDQLSARCPLPDHDDTHPSFYVSLTKRRFYCHGCKHGGDVIELYRLLNGASFRQAVDTLLHRCGPPPAGNTDAPPAAPRAAPRPRMVITAKHREILDNVAALYRHRAATSQDFAHYLEGRGFRPLHSKGLGWAPRSGVDLEGFFEVEDQEILRDLGLLDQKGGRTFERMRAAVIFTVTDLAGSPVGFVARRIEGEPKYLNSTFPKQVFPLGLAEARDVMADSRNVVLVEGPFDWLALRAAGLENVLALLGSEISGELCSLLRVIGVTDAKILFDGDTAGRVAGEVAAARLRSFGIEASRVELPSGTDPADLWRDKGCEANQALLRSRKARPVTSATLAASRPDSNST